MSDLQQKFNALLKVNEQLLEANKELADALKQQAAVIEQMRDALRSIRLICDQKYGWPIIDKALALQPCPEVLNKVRADAVAAFLAEKQVIYGTVLVKDRIKKGEA